ncbi:GntR family transcriptional regulator [Corynebacterium aurimucosum]|uniref:GntR family transcriptional regulator n=1 Tax=Corynebacterium aurimucosum TaxID=169292 RepID=UPI001D0D2DB8|nr:GntR family transcriptional regulator [Corynebacterium aurimucosum]
MRKGRVTHGIDRLMQAIADKEFELEQAIPGEAKLAEFLDVSRPTMREVVLLRHRFARHTLYVVCAGSA